MVTFLHTSDWQIGKTLRHLSADDQARYSGDRIRTIRTLADRARDHHAEFIVVAGDVFEHHNISEALLRRTVDAMAETGIDFYLLPGNHDPLSPGSVWEHELFGEKKPANVHVLTGTMSRDNVELLGIPWMSKNPGCDPVLSFLPEIKPTQVPRILVGHGMLSTLNPDAHSLESVSYQGVRDLVENSMITYVALGDRHLAWRDETGTIAYSGTHEATDFAEKTPGTALVVQVGDTVETELITVGSWQYVDIDATLNTDDDLVAFEDHISSLRGKDSTIARTSLSGTLNLAQFARLDAMLDKHADAFAAFYAWERHTHLVAVPDDMDVDALGLAGFALSAAHELQDAAQNGDDEASDALRLLYRLGVQ